MEYEQLKKYIDPDFREIEIDYGCRGVNAKYGGYEVVYNPSDTGYCLSQCCIKMGYTNAPSGISKESELAAVAPGYLYYDGNQILSRGNVPTPAILLDATRRHAVIVEPVYGTNCLELVLQDLVTRTQTNVWQSGADYFEYVKDVGLNWYNVVTGQTSKLVFPVKASDLPISLDQIFYQNNLPLIYSKV